MPNLNDQAHFSQVPSTSINRSVFDRSHGWKGTSKTGLLNVDFIDEILPGDSVDIKEYMLTRSISPFVRPVMDNVYVDQYFFWCPDRLLWTNFTAFMGEGDPSQWTTPSTLTIPTAACDDQSGHPRTVGDLAHEMGIPVGVTSANGQLNALPFRMYKKVYNEWFRDENLQNPVAISLGDTETMTSTYFNLLPAGRIHDYFGSCLPNTQKGEAVKIALQGLIPVSTLPSTFQSPTLSTQAKGTWARTDLAEPGVTTLSPLMMWNAAAYTNPTANLALYAYGSTSAANAGRVMGASVSGAGQTTFTPANLVANVGSGGTSIGIDINALRLAVATQQILETMARGGSRYVELLKSMFNTVSPDANQGRSELLGYSRQMISQQEIQNTANSTGNPLGLVAGNVKSTDDKLAFTHSFSEHGYLMGIFVIRENRSYSQGVDAMWYRKQFADFYLPALANIGEQPVYKRELYALSNYTAGVDDIFGYQSAWESYRFKQSRNTCLLDPAVANTLGLDYTFGDVYPSAPTLSDQWIQNGNGNVHRTLTITDSSAPDWLHDVWFDYKHTRPIPVYSVPGLDKL